jgi:hypothetical protein
LLATPSHSLSKESSVNRSLIACVILALAALPARAHFIWIIPSPDGNGARVVFNDAPKAGGPELLPRIAQAEFWLREAGGDVRPVAKTLDGDAYRLAVAGAPPCTLGGECHYGVTSRGSKEPFLLVYHCRAGVPFAQGKQPAGPWDRLALEVVPLAGGDAGHFQVLWHGQPLAGASVTASTADEAKPVTLKTDDQGRFSYVTAGGLVGLRVLHEEKITGDYQGKAYKSIRHYATLVFEAPSKK